MLVGIGSRILHICLGGIIAVYGGYQIASSQGSIVWNGLSGIVGLLVMFGKVDSGFGGGGFLDSIVGGGD